MKQFHTPRTNNNLPHPRKYQSHTNTTIRNVSNITKKIVASNQGWHCGHCHTQLDFTYEIDHIIPLFRGGSNETRNLIALCRNCHGKKTIRERIKK
jgi:5-methylcytosine-specific restriction endonuclease McrA